MKKRYLIEKTNEVINETRNALQTIYDSLNQGQQKKLLKEDEVAILFERYGVEL